MNLIPLERKFSLAYLTVSDLSPVQAVEVAARAGFTHVGLRCLPAFDGEQLFPLLTNRELSIELEAALIDSEVGIGDLELIRINSGFNVFDYEVFFEFAAKFEATNIIVLGDDPDINRFTESFHQLCEFAFKFGLFMNLEPIPWTSIKKIEEAIVVLEKLPNQSNASLLVDAFHFYRSQSELDLLSRVTKDKFRIFQICDAPIKYVSNLEEIRNEARNARLLPGDGQLDLVTLLNKIPHHALISVEVPSVQLRMINPLERAKFALQKTKDICLAVDLFQENIVN